MPKRSPTGEPAIDRKLIESLTKSVDRLGFVLARLLLHFACRRGSQSEQAKLLRSAGLTNSEIAALLQVSGNHVAVVLGRATRKRAGASRRR